MRVRRLISTIAVLAVAATAQAQPDRAPRETVTAELGGKKVAVEYGRPSLQGRAVKDLLAQLPANRVWRAGVDQATTLTTDDRHPRRRQEGPRRQIHAVPATRRSPGSYELLVNRDPGREAQDDLRRRARPPWPTRMWPHIEDYPTIKDKEVARVALKSAPADSGARGPVPRDHGSGQGRRLRPHAELGRPELDDRRPRGGQIAASPEAGGRRAAAVAALLLLGLSLQLYFFRHYPQPPLFGDPAGYYNVGQRFQEALQRLGAGEPVSTVFASVRGLFYLAGVGTLFGILDGLWPGNTARFRDVMAVFNTATMFGVFVLARRLSGSFAGGLAALALAAVYPTFSVQTGRLYPDPLTTALLVWAAATYAAAHHVRLAPRDGGGGAPLRAGPSRALAGARIHGGGDRAGAPRHRSALGAPRRRRAASSSPSSSAWRRRSSPGARSAGRWDRATTSSAWDRSPSVRPIRSASGSSSRRTAGRDRTGSSRTRSTRTWKRKPGPAIRTCSARARSRRPSPCATWPRARSPPSSSSSTTPTASTTGRRTTTSGTTRSRTRSRSPSSAWCWFSASRERPGSWPSARRWPACSSSPWPWPSFTGWSSPGRATTCRPCPC